DRGRPAVAGRPGYQNGQSTSRPPPRAPKATFLRCLGIGPQTTGPFLTPLAGLVAATDPLSDHIQPVVGVDEGDEGHQRAKLVIVVVLGGVRPHVVADAASAIGDPRAVLSEFQRRPLGLAENIRVAPYRDQTEPNLALPGTRRGLRVHVG